VTSKRTSTTAAAARGRRHRLEDVARLAGVGKATVDRVLNERGNVSEKTAEKVLKVARRLNLTRVLPTSHHRLLRIEVLLARPELPLIDRMKFEFQRLAAQIDRSVIIQRTTLATEEPKQLAAHIRATQCDAVVVYAQEHPAVHGAIDDARRRGVEVVTMISDLPHTSRLAYAGTDHYSAGRTAGFFMARMLQDAGPIIVLCNHFGFQCHEERVRGFRDALLASAPSFPIAGIIEGGDDSARSERLLLRAFREHRDTVGFYNVGAANDAAGTALRAGLLRRRPVFIGHELTHETRPMLRDGTMTIAIDQNPEQQARFALDVLLHHFGFTEPGAMALPYQSNVSFRLYTAENIVEPSPRVFK
jgi:LacI family transcriptional regulator